ncbi:L,D-transpeptidase family protein [Thiobacter aerophilum]|uniref:L,D-transpeptidase family protein n=1 Tax=Thiobacter aerophilum TaxID=3121275 RepID=A0ABV0EDL9_9BURK
MRAQRGYRSFSWREALSAHRGKLTVLFTWLLLVPLAEPPATAMGSRPRVVATSPAPQPRTPESLLVQSLLDIQHNRLDQALEKIDTVLRIEPNFRLAHLIKGDLLMARARPIATLGNVADERVPDFREEARVRLKRYLEPLPQDRIPEYLLKLDPAQSHALVVDTSRSRLFIYRNDQGEPRYVTDFYVTVGKRGADKYREGDQRTPVGVYFVTDDLPPARLTDFYGAGAFPISYPNEWDRRQGRNGSGIWLHGVPSDTYSRPPRASNGCVVLSNEDLSTLRQYLNVGHTPVIITDGITWMDRNLWRSEREAISREIERWRRDWESLDTERYLAHYSPSFSSGELDFSAWAAQKRQVNASKTHVRITLSNLSILRYPGREKLVVVTFEQDYRSNNLEQTMRKRQYWREENGVWKIVYEGAV